MSSSPPSASSSFFEWLCDALERATSLDTLEARGTARLAIKQTGFEVRRITREQLYVVVRRVLAHELRARSVADPEGVCESLAQGIQRLAPAPRPSAEAPETVFRRLGADG